MRIHTARQSSGIDSTVLCDGKGGPGSSENSGCAAGSGVGDAGPEMRGLPCL